MVSKASRVRARLTSNIKHQVPSLNLLSLSRSVVCRHCTESLQKSWDVSGVQERPQRPGSPCRSCFSRQHLAQCLGLYRRLLNVGRNLKSGGIWIQTSNLPLWSSSPCICFLFTTLQNRRLMSQDWEGHEPAADCLDPQLPHL